MFLYRQRWTERRRELILSAARIAHQASRDGIAALRAGHSHREIAQLHLHATGNRAGAIAP